MPGNKAVIRVMIEQVTISPGVGHACCCCPLPRPAAPGSSSVQPRPAKHRAQHAAQSPLAVFPSTLPVNRSHRFHGASTDCAGLGSSGSSLYNSQSSTATRQRSASRPLSKTCCCGGERKKWRSTKWGGLYKKKVNGVCSRRVQRTSSVLRRERRAHRRAPVPPHGDSRPSCASSAR